MSVDGCCEPLGVEQWSKERGKEEAEEGKQRAPRSKPKKKLDDRIMHPCFTPDTTSTQPYTGLRHYSA